GPTCQSLFLPFSAHLPPASPRCGAATRRGSCTRLRTRTTRSTSYTRRACRVPPLGAWRARPGRVVAQHLPRGAALRDIPGPHPACGDDERMSPASNHNLAQSVNWCCLRCASSGAMRTTWPSATSRGRCCATCTRFPTACTSSSTASTRHSSSRTALGRAFREDLTLLKGANLVLGVSC
uniref:Uncharacterized protein n=1 Tax=Oryza glaberrima TaxID=4538 RepID=I1QTG7_ORYGL